MTSPPQNAVDGAPSLVGTNLDIEAEILQISTALSSGPDQPDDQALGAEDIKELLSQLNSADTLAQGVESKLDSVLENLDRLLTLFGTDDGVESQTDEGTKSENKSSKD
jgi:hypothetical protein